MKTGIGSHTRAVRGQTDDWITPPEIITALGGSMSFTLDPCASLNQPWPCAKSHYDIVRNGLSPNCPWRGRVWLNPPYGQQTGRWLERLADHGHGTALIFARTETEMFHRFVWERAAALLFLEGRLYFHTPDGKRANGNAGGPSVIVAYGESDSAILRRCGLKGAFVKP